MARSGGVPGLAVALATAGGFLLYSGIRDVNLLTGLREILRGQAPTPGPPRPSRTDDILGGLGGALAGGSGGPAGGVSSGGGGMGARIVQEAKQHLGKPYVFGASGPNSFDCSGLVKYVFARVGAPMTGIPHSAFAQTQWSKLRKVSRAECGAGDLVWWPGHIGIAIDNRNGIFAPRPGRNVEISSIDVSGPRKGPPTLCLRYTG